MKEVDDGVRGARPSNAASAHQTPVATNWSIELKLAVKTLIGFMISPKAQR
jgi:hypothetical protein